MSAALARFRRRSPLPGFGLSLGYSTLYLSLIVLIPFAVMLARASSSGWAAFAAAVWTPRLLASYRLTFGASLLAAIINSGLGFLVAWMLARYRFPGRRLLDALIDLPFALPTSVAGITLAFIFGPNGWIGRWFNAYGIGLAFNACGIVIALVFVGLPFVVRTLQPVIEELGTEEEEAAGLLGASRGLTFRHVIWPALRPALLTGFGLAFARGVGEYGSVIFIAGNRPFVSEITSLLVITKLEQFDFTGAASIAVVMLAVSFLVLFSLNLAQKFMLPRSSGGAQR
ncbi:sulfate ABC transporter permease subunit CysT [Burkholderia sp. WAC0059]|uniref:sulfate ABC transporter permease subunit CysT n=1 Tax=Burkholderia sp. WAC0059 TaxID=2066022 RepID=UPI000C7F0F94|nr:sulfate ABC transporter permease subunit CysT [Burkholderia sp. WAC0059]PLZ01260.1 sulfate ABC transporter permease subunit CysT [Burkholderia sp. WAC0059]